MVCVFCNDTATTEIYTLSLHDALPISDGLGAVARPSAASSSSRSEVPRRRCKSCTLARRRALRAACGIYSSSRSPRRLFRRSEEHTSELQSRQYLVCRLLLEKTHDRRP